MINFSSMVDNHYVTFRELVLIIKINLVCYAYALFLPCFVKLPNRSSDCVLVIKTLEDLVPSSILVSQSMEPL